MASQLSTKEKQFECIKQAEKTLDVFELLLVGDMGDYRSAIRNDNYLKIFRQFAGWAHFSGREYLDLRRIEKELLLKLTEKAPLDICSVYRELSPWHKPLEIRDDESKELYLEVMKVLEGRLLEYTKDLLLRPGGLDGLVFPDAMAVYYMLLRKRSPFWSEANTRWFRDVVITRAHSDVRIQDNLIWLFRAIVHGAGDPIDPVRPEEAEELVKDEEIMSEIWRGATLKGVNKRIMGTLREHVETVKKLSGLQLPLPVMAELD